MRPLPTWPSSPALSRRGCAWVGGHDSQAMLQMRPEQPPQWRQEVCSDSCGAQHGPKGLTRDLCSPIPRLKMVLNTHYEGQGWGDKAARWRNAQRKGLHLDLQGVQGSSCLTTHHLPVDKPQSQQSSIQLPSVPLANATGKPGVWKRCRCPQSGSDSRGSRTG